MNTKIDWVFRKFAYLYLQLTIGFFHFLLLCLRLFHTKKSPKEVKSIAALWYYPPDLTGSNLRLGGWTKFFENDGYQYDNFYINSIKEYVDSIEKGSWTDKYLFFQKCYARRIPQLFKIVKYDVLWIDRGFIPFYPRKGAFVERQLKKIVPHVVVDCTDGGDFSANPKLVSEIFDTADKITVGYKYLVSYFGEKYNNITQIYWTIPSENYQVRKDTSLAELPVLGWMGNPTNAQHLKKITGELVKLHKRTPFQLSYICRENLHLDLPGIKVNHFTFEDDYYKILGTFDVGLCPFLKSTIREKGKIAMKHQEFLLGGTPQVCSPVAISEFVVDNETVMIANSLEEWSEKLYEVLTNDELRKTLSRNSRALYESKYQFETSYPKLKRVLTEF